VGLSDLKTGQLFCDKLRLIYLQLPFFIKEADDCNDDFERWIYVLKNMETLNRMPWTAQNAVFQRLAEIAEVSAMSKDERIKYDHALKVYRDTQNAYNTAVQKGRAEGEMVKALEIAKKLKSMGLSLTDIAKATGLTEDEISM
jgi:predicted transposase/invertase (TIGR01784 family)